MSDFPDELSVLRYGVKWKPLRAGKGWVRVPDWNIELQLLQIPEGEPKPRGYRGFEFHFKNLVTALLGNPNGIFGFQWNPNAERILKFIVKHKMLAICGCASSGKSRSLAGIAVCYWLIDPFNTKILVTSTTVKTAKGKIWGDISEAWDAACQEVGGEGNLPGRKLATQQIRYECGGVKSDKGGIELIPTDANKQKEASEKMQGYKRGKVILLGDEWDTLPPMLLKTARSNLFANPEFRLWGAFNPTGRFTNGGILAKPKAGWDSIDEHSYDWETETGWCIRFDGLQSPNVMLHRIVWTGLFDDEKLAKYRSELGEDSPGFWVMVRGWFPPTGEANTLYSEAELVSKYCCNKTLEASQGGWESRFEMVAGLDPAWLHGGDRAVLTIGRCGMAQFTAFGKRQSRRILERAKTIVLDTEMNRNEDKSEEIIRLLKKYMGVFGIVSKNIAVDVTGAASFVTLLNRDIGSDFISTSFAKKPSDLRISKADKRKSSDVYRDIGSEIWCVGKELVRSQQILGLDDDTMEEMCARQFKPGNAEKGILTAIAPKDTMRNFGHPSPDRADSFFLCLHAARVRCNLSSDERAIPKPTEQAPQAHGILNRLKLNLDVAVGAVKAPRKNPFADDGEKQFMTGGWDNDNFY